MTIFFISDVHLNQENPKSYNLLTKFFNNLPPTTQAIYILGDLFEYWVDDNINNQFLIEVKQLLQTISNKISIYFIHGNRDFLIGSTFAQQTNIKILPEFYKINIYGYNILLTHGDALMPDPLHYYFSKIIRHPITRLIAKILPISLKLIIAKQIRNLSKNRFKNNKNQNLYDASQQLIETYLTKYSCNILIHGHTHQPNVYNFNIKDKMFTRVVLGDWHDFTHVLLFNDHNYKLEKICSN